VILGDLMLVILVYEAHLGSYLETLVVIGLKHVWSGKLPLVKDRPRNRPVLLDLLCCQCGFESFPSLSKMRSLRSQQCHTISICAERPIPLEVSKREI
jgi:hypothetical protein